MDAGIVQIKLIKIHCERYIVKETKYYVDLNNSYYRKHFLDHENLHSRPLFDDHHHVNVVIAATNEPIVHSPGDI
jgi:hypothetical protein